MGFFEAGHAGPADDGLESLETSRANETGRHRCRVDGVEVDIAVFDVHPPLRLLLFGAGPEAAPLLSFAQALGWFTVLVDHRQALLDGHHCMADRVLMGRPAAAAAELESIRFDAVVAMTHLACTDLDVLKLMAARPIPYVGLLGPASRRDGLLAQLDGERACP